jgi:hypothetical protein
MFVLDFFFIIDNSIIVTQNIEEKDVVFNNFLSFLKKNIKEEINAEIENDDFLKNFNERYN